MSLFILTETSAGYALLKAKDRKLTKRPDLAEELSTVEGTCNLLKLKHFQKFESAAAALEEASALVEGKVTPRLALLLDPLKDEKKASLAVADPKLANAINKLPQLSITPVSDSSTVDLYRAIRANLPSLIPGLLPDDISTMSLGLSHSLSRHKLKFSPDKLDTMIIQAISLLDDLDKELNTYAMRVKEWYGWHFPEMAKIINDNLAYARVIMQMGERPKAATADLSEILPEEIEIAVKAAAEISMGTEITAEDLDTIRSIAEQVVSLSEYRQQLASYLSSRMQAIAPNLTALVGDLVGARLISHAGNLMNLAKSPASTIQILGAEKALFRALKTKHDTPKYGILFHASLIGQATGKNKGKIARMLATKAALALRVDALSDWGTCGAGLGKEPSEEEKRAIGVESRIRLERRLRAMEGKPLGPKGTNVGPDGRAQGKWEIKEARKYNIDADGLYGDEPAAAITEPATDSTLENQHQQETESTAPKSKDQEADKKTKLIEEVVMEDAPVNGADATGATKDKDLAKDEDDEDDEDEDDEDDEDEEDEVKAEVKAEAKDKAKDKAKDRDEGKVGQSESEEEEDDDDDDDDDSDAEDVPVPRTDGGEASGSDPKAKRRADKEAKLARKVARAEKRARKDARRVARKAKAARKAGAKGRGKGAGEGGNASGGATGTAARPSKDEKYKREKKRRQDTAAAAAAAAGAGTDVVLDVGKKRKRADGAEKTKEKKKQKQKR